MSVALPSRGSGVLLHPTSLPGRFGIGELGQEAHRFVDFLAAARQSLWQVLPVGPTWYDYHCPYMSFSAFAGNPLLISLEVLKDKGLLEPDELKRTPDFSSDRVDYGRVEEFKWPLLQRAAARFRSSGGEARARVGTFVRSQSFWLKDYALFMALRERHGGQRWSQWPEALRRRESGALGSARQELDDAIWLQYFVQFEFAEQWSALRRYAHERGVRLLGDMPIYVAQDSADVWTWPQYFHVDPVTGEQRWQAGAAPDNFFTSEGQLWGNPVYDWPRLEADGYGWWMNRLATCFDQFDLVRLDHFRGFEAYWAVPTDASSAKQGHWEPGPGRDFFRAVQERFPKLPIIVEDLGFITPAVHALREEFGLPGMFVMHFAFGSGPDNPYLPYKCRPDFVMYTGTHDTDTTLGWFRALDAESRSALLEYLGLPGCDEPHWEVLRVVMASVARWAVVPLQDVLGLGSEARMNVPGTSGPHNWSWRFRQEALTSKMSEHLASLTRIYGRG